MRFDESFAKSDSFIVAFEGGLIECVNLEDAIAIKNCAAILAHGVADGNSSAALERFATVLSRYDKEEAAERMSQLASRTRAIQFIVATG